MNNYSEIIPWIPTESIPFSPKLRHNIFSNMNNLEIRKAVIMMPVRFEFINGIKWKLIEDMKEIYNLCQESDIEPVFAFLPHNSSSSYATNIVIPKNTKAFYDFLRIADRIRPDDFYPYIAKFYPLFEKNREDYIVGAWTYNHMFFPAAYRPFHSEKLFKEIISTTGEFWDLNPMSREWSLGRYDFFAIKNDFNRPYSSTSVDREFYLQCSKIGFPLILTFDLFESKYNGKEKIISFKTPEKFASQTAYGGDGFLDYTLRKCPDELFSQIEKIDIDYVINCFD